MGYAQMNDKIIQLDIPADLAESIKQQIDTYLDEQKPVEWEPKYIINISTSRIDARTDEHEVALSTVVDNEEQADDLAQLLSRTARLHAWSSEHGYLKEWEDEDANWYVFHNGDDNWYVFPNGGKWQSASVKMFNTPTEVYMTKEGAEATAEALNDGILTL